MSYIKIFATPYDLYSLQESGKYNYTWTQQGLSGSFYSSPIFNYQDCYPLYSQYSNVVGCTTNGYPGFYYKVYNERISLKDIKSNGNTSIIRLNNDFVTGIGNNSDGALNFNKYIKSEDVLDFDLTKLGAYSTRYRTTSFFVLKNNTITGFGNNDFLQLSTIPQSIQGKVTKVKAGDIHTIVLLKDGTVTGWGTYNGIYPNPAPPITTDNPAVDIAAAGNLSIALLKDGTVTGWGQGNNSILVNRSSSIFPQNIQGNVTGISMSRTAIFAYLKDGTLTGTGSSSYSNQIRSLGTNILEVAPGDNFVGVLLKDGTVSGFGINSPPTGNYPVLNFPVIPIKNINDPKFNLNITSSYYTPLTYSSTNSNVATVDNNGDVTIVGHGVCDLEVNYISPYPSASVSSQTFRERKSLYVSPNCNTFKDVKYYPSFSIGLLENGFITGFLNTATATTSPSSWWELSRLNPSYDNLSQGRNNLKNIQGNIENIAVGDKFIIGLLKDGTVTGWGNPEAGYTEVLNIPNIVQNNTVSIVAGNYHVLALLKDGRVTGWGLGKLDNNNFVDEGQLIIPSNIQNNATGIIAGSYSSFALLKDGTVTGWGLNRYLLNVPSDIQGNITGIRGNYGTFSLLLKDKTAYILGSITNTNLIDNFNSIPFYAKNNIKDIACETDRVTILYDNGFVTGFYVKNQLYTYSIPGLGTTSEYISAMFSNNYVPSNLGNNVKKLLGINLALLNDNTISGWKDASLDYSPVRSKCSQDITFPTILNKKIGDEPFRLNANSSASLKLFYTSTSTYVTVDASGLATIKSAGPASITAIAPSNNYFDSASKTAYFIINKNDQSLTFPSIPSKNYGDVNFNLGVTSTNSTIPVTYSSSNTSVATVSSNGTVSIVGVGNATITASQAGNSNFEPAIPVSQSFNVICDNIKDIFAGSQCVLALLKNSEVTGWGNNTYGELNPPSSVQGNVAKISPPRFAYKNTLALLKDGRVTGWGQSFVPGFDYGFDVYGTKGNYEANIPDRIGTGILNGSPRVRATQISVGDRYALALLEDGRVTGWGLNDKSQLQIPSIIGTSGVAVSASTNYSTALLSNGRLITWGLYIPTFADLGTGITGITEDYGNHNLALLKDGRVTGWRDNSYGQLNIPAGIGTNASGIAVGIGHSLALLKDGRVTGWGQNNAGQINIPSNIQGNVTKIIGGLGFSMALLKDGTVTGWGYNDRGPLNVPKSINCTFGKLYQNITFPEISDKSSTDPVFLLSGFSDSNLPLSYSSSNPLIASISGATGVKINNVGSVTITATQAGNSNFEPAIPVSRSFNVLKVNQTITFPSIPTKNFGDVNFNLGVTSTNSTIPVTYSSSNTSVATVSSNGTVSIVGAGNATITANQVENSYYNAATSVSQTFTVNKVDQTLTFPSIPTKNYGDAPFSLNATASSNLGVTYTSSNTNVATINGNTVTVVGVGSATITASQPGNSNYNSAVSVSQNLTINKKNQLIELNIPSFKSLGDLPFNLQANSNSNLPIYFSSNNPILTIQGNLATINDIGIVVITAYQEENENWIAAQTTASIIIKKTSKLEFPKIEYKQFGDSSFNLNVTTDNNEVSIQYESSNSSIAQVSSIGVVTILKAGTVTITAKQNETSSFFQNSNSRQLYIDASKLNIEPIEQSPFYTNYSAQKYSNRIDNEIYNLYLPKVYESHTLLLDLNLYGFDEDEMADCDIEMNAFILRTGLFGEIVKNPTILNIEIKDLLPPTGILFDVNDHLKERNILKNIQVNNTLYYNTSYYKNNTIYSDKRFSFIKNEIFISKPAASRGKNIPYPLLFEYKSPVSNLAYNIGEYSLAIFDENDNKIKDGNFITGTETGFLTFLNPGKYNLILSGNEKDFLINETNQNKKNENLHAVSLNIKSLTEQKITEIYKQNYDEVWASYYLDYRDLPSGSYALNDQAPIAFNIDFERNTSGSIESPSLSFKEYTGYYENNCSSSTRVIMSDPICTKSLQFICRLGADYESSGFRQMDIPRKNFPKSKYGVIVPSPINASTDITKQLEEETLERTLLTYLEDPTDTNYYTIAIDDNLKQTCCYCKAESDWEDPTAYIQGQIYSGISVSDSGDAIYNSVYFMDDISPKGLDLKYNNSYYSGQITYKGFEEGDKVLFNQYQFDFDAVFKSIYDIDDIPFEKKAIVKEFIFSENSTGQNYFSGKNDLINKINNELAFKKYYTWVPFKNNPNIEFNYGPLLSGQNGGINSNNEEIINLVPLNSGKFGAFSMKLELTPRNKVYSYMVPKIIKLQISEDGENWIDVVSSEYRQPINTYLNSPDDTVFPPIEDTNIKYENLQDETITITQKITISSETSSQNKNASDIEDLSGLATGLWSVSPYNTGYKNSSSTTNNSLICIPSITGSGILCGSGYTDFIIGNTSQKGGFKCAVSEGPEDCGIWKPSGDYLSLDCDPELIGKPKYLGYSGSCCSGIYDPIKRPTGWCCSGIYQNGVNEIGCKPCADITDPPVDENKSEETIEVKKDINVFRLGFYDYNS